MTNNQDKQMVEDQAFIDALYQELEEENATDEQRPNEQLDNRILAAAHKAVTSKPMAHKAAQKKTKSWFYPLATAASVVLMITVINHQIPSPILGNEAQPVASQLNSSDSITEELALSMSDSVELQQDSMESVFSNEEQAQPIAEMKESRMLAKSGIAAASESKKSMLSAKQSLSKPMMAEAESVMSAPLEMDSIKNPISLTTKQYLQLKEISQQELIYWQLLSEDETSYIIKLQLSNQADTLYRLNKNNFELNKNIPPEKNTFPQIKRTHKNQ